MSLNYISQYNEAVFFENPNPFLDREQQGLHAKLQKPIQKENLWTSLKKSLTSVDNCFSFLRSTFSFSSGSRNYFQQFSEVLVPSSLVKLCPSASRAAESSSPSLNAITPKKKLNLNNFLMCVLCSCIPVGSCAPPPTKIMVCLPCPPPVMAAPYAGSMSSQNRCKSHPFCVPEKLEQCLTQETKKGKYLPPPARRQCSEKCLHVCDLRPPKPCLADNGSPCVAHCFESRAKCPSH